VQAAVGLAEQVAAHGCDRADVERDEREQGDSHDAGHHLEPQLDAQQAPQQRSGTGSSPGNHRIRLPFIGAG
jgi:hypothetical protein